MFVRSVFERQANIFFLNFRPLWHLVSVTNGQFIDWAVIANPIDTMLNADPRSSKWLHGTSSYLHHHPPAPFVVRDQPLILHL